MQLWHLWGYLTVMLAFGGICKVGVLLREFAIAALVTTGLAALGLELATQLNCFIFCTLILIAGKRLRKLSA